MSRVEREWTRRIPGYRWVNRRTPGEPSPEGEGDASSEDAAGEETEAQASSDEEMPADDSAEAPETDPRLQVPPEVEAARKEARERKQRTPLNMHLAHQSFSLQGHYLRALATRFARMISKVAEDSADLPQPGDEEWDLNELSRRRFTGRHVHQCRMVRERRKVALVLDTSPSCAHQSRLFSNIARIAEELGDCELYDAPNFGIVSRKVTGEWQPLPEVERNWQFKGRVVIAFGDFDGLEHICAASRVPGNKLYWFSCEDRPEVLERQREYFTREYRGHYFAANSLNQFMKAMMRVR